MNDKWCESDLGKNLVQYPTLQEAENACNKDKNCKAFYDSQSKNDTFILCGGSLAQPSKFEKSTLFMKCSSVKYYDSFQF